MTYKLLTAAAFSLALGTAAFAQATLAPDAEATPDAGMPMEWEGPVGEAFFSDPAVGTLRSEEEVRANWENLTADQQAQVREHCETVDVAAAENLESPPAAEDEQLTTGSIHTASIGQLCGWLNTM